MKLSYIAQVAEELNCLIVNPVDNYQPSKVVNMNKVISKVEQRIIRWEGVSEEVFLKNNPGATYTGQKNFAGREIWECFHYQYEEIPFHSPKQLDFILRQVKEEYNL